MPPKIAPKSKVGKGAPKGLPLLVEKGSDNVPKVVVGKNCPDRPADRLQIMAAPSKAVSFT